MTRQSNSDALLMGYAPPRCVYNYVTLFTGIDSSPRVRAIDLKTGDVLRKEIVSAPAVAFSLP